VCGQAVHDPAALDGVRLTSICLATIIGGVTATGSLVAFGKLNGSLGSAALALPGAHAHAIATPFARQPHSWPRTLALPAAARPATTGALPHGPLG
jgi:hypothetical protein